MSANRWVGAATLVALLAATAVVSATTPTEAQWEQPFVVTAPLGESAAGRNIAGTVHGAQLADTIGDSAWQSGEGSVWLLVDASVESVVSDDVTLASAVVTIGALTYSASDRPQFSTLRAAGLSTGIPTRGTLAFELPATILDEQGADAAELHLSSAALDDTRLDSVLVTPLDLTALDHVDDVTIAAPVWGQG